MDNRTDILFKKKFKKDYWKKIKYLMEYTNEMNGDESYPIN